MTGHTHLPSAGLEALEARRQKWRDDGTYPSTTIGAAMQSAADRDPDDVRHFLTRSGELNTTLSDVAAASRRVMAALQRRGIGPGDKVAVHLTNGLEAVIAYGAVFAMEAVLVPIPDIYRDTEVMFILADSGARCYIAESRVVDLPECRGIRGLAQRDDAPVLVSVGQPVEGWEPWTALVDETSTPDVHAREASSLAAIIYTSGSTSVPKGVKHSHETLLSELQHGYPASRLEAARMWLDVLPFGHMAGLLGLLRMLLFAGETVCLDRWDAALFVSSVTRFEVDATQLPPFHITTVLEHLEAAGIERLPLRDVGSGASVVQPSLIEDADAKGIVAFRMYGSSEHPTVSSASADDSVRLRGHTDGPVLPGVEVRVVDSAGEEVAEGVDGEIFTCGPDLFLGYTDDALTAAALTDDGWFRTGDLGVLVDGVLTITGRAKEVIIRGGENISPTEVEGFVIKHPKVVEVAVVGRPDARYGERIWAFVILQADASLTLDELKTFFREQGVATQKTPEGIVVVEDFPRTAAGKIKKPQLAGTLGDA